MDVQYQTPYGVFEWDSKKRELNLRKHKLDFVVAVEVFADEGAIIKYDSLHSGSEDRYVVTGMIRAILIVAVVFTERQNSITRIISARKAEPDEVAEYERNRFFRP